MDIDIATGLPEVPEGLFWRIRERPSYTFHTKERTDDGELWVELCTEGMVTESYKRRPDLTWKNIWIYPFLEDSVDDERDVPGVIVLGEKMMADTEKEYRFDNMDKFLEQGYVIRSYQDPYSTSYSFIRMIEPTAENVREIATSVLEAYKSEQVKKADEALKLKQRQALIGTYPPKKLIMGDVNE